MTRRLSKSEPRRGEYYAYITLSALCFGYQALLLSFLPIVALDLGGSTAYAGLLVSLFAGIGMLSDSRIGRVVYRYGVRTTVLIGTGLAVAGLGFLFASANLQLLTTAAAIAGISTSFQITPILGGLSTHAGENQVRAQGTNSIVQRSGALIAALFLNGLLEDREHYDTVYVALSLIVLLLVLSCLALPRSSGVDQERLRTGLSSPQPGVLSVVQSSRPLRAALVFSVTGPLMTVFGSSFIPLFLLQLMHPALLVPCLVGREAVAIMTAAMAKWLNRREALVPVWEGLSVLGITGVFAALSVGPAPLIVMLFSLHGACIGAGIIIGNTSIYDATSEANRMYAFAAGSIVSRTTGLLFPVLLGVAVGESIHLAALIVACALLGGIVVHRILSRDPPKTAMGARMR